jgi:RHS repeat-associated protein
VRYKFTGKERDAETGYDYFGARYYSSELSVWLSVDPLADKYPGISAYAYVFNNPVMLIDPWGLEGGKPGKVRLRHLHSDRNGQEKFRFKNKTTGEIGYIYTPKGKKTKDVKNDFKNGTLNNYDIFTYKNDKLVEEKHYDNNGDLMGDPIYGGSLSEVEIIAKGHSQAYYEHKKAGDLYLDHSHFTKFIYHKPNNIKYWVIGGLGFINTESAALLSVREMLNDKNYNDAYFKALEKYDSKNETQGIFIKYTVYPGMIVSSSTYEFYSATTGELLSKCSKYH